MKYRNLFLFLSIAVFNSNILALMPIAEVIKLRGSISVLSPGAHQARSISIGDKLVEDSSVLTGPNSFVKIKFIDNSEMNVGPESKIVINEMKENKPGVIALLKGRLRADVEKESKQTNLKFFIKTRSAAMGVRGTEFQTIYNPDNKVTSLLTYEGEVLMAKVDETEVSPKSLKNLNLERDSVTNTIRVNQKDFEIQDESVFLDKALQKKEVVAVKAGQNSLVAEGIKKATLPVNISPVQLNSLFKNEEFKVKPTENLNANSGILDVSKMTIKPVPQIAPKEGLINNSTGDFAPKSGGYVDLESGLYVAPGSESQFNDKLGVYVAKNVGGIDLETGQYVAPDGLKLDAKKGFVLASDSEKNPELIAFKSDLNKNISKDVLAIETEVEKKVNFNIDEKFVNNLIQIQLLAGSETISVNKDGQSTNSQFDIKTKAMQSSGVKFHWEWSNVGQYRPFFTFQFLQNNYLGNVPTDVTQESRKLFQMNFGGKFALSRQFDLVGSFAIFQNHYLNQTALSPQSYTLSRVAVNKLGLGLNTHFFEEQTIGIETSLLAYYSFRKRLNNVVVYSGPSFELGFGPYIKLSSKSDLNFSLNLKNEKSKVTGSSSQNKMDKTNSSLGLGYRVQFN